MVTAGISVLRQSCRKTNITIITKMMASTSVFSTSRMESPTKVVVSKATAYFNPGGKRYRQPVEFRPHRLVHIQSIRGGQLGDADADAVIAIEAQA